MSILIILEQLASTPHHKINLEELLKDSKPSVKSAFSKNDCSAFKDIFNVNNILADRTTVFEY